MSAELLEADYSNCVGGQGTNLATFRPTCGAGNMDVSMAISGLIVEKSIEDNVPSLVSLLLLFPCTSKNVSDQSYKVQELVFYSVFTSTYHDKSSSL